LLAGVGLLVAVASAPAQQPVAPRQTRLVDSVGTDAIVRLANQLRTLQDAEQDPRFQDALRAMRQANPDLSPEQLQLAMDFLRQNPIYRDPEKLRQLAGGLGGNGMLDGLAGLDPKNLPKLPPFVPPDETRIPSGPATPRRTGSDREGASAPPEFEPPEEPRGGHGEDEFPHTGAPPGGWTGSPPPRMDAAIDPEQFARRRQQFEAMQRFWEQNVGPLKDTPTVKQLMREMFLGNPHSTTGTETIGDLVDAASRGDGPELRQWLKDSGLSDWKFPDLGWGDRKARGRDFRTDWSRTMPAGGAPSWPRFGYAGDSWLPVILFGLIAAGALVLWWLWPKLTAGREAAPRPLPGLGPWPVDPRRIADREALVRAFEYLSVLLCGQGVKTWNHVVIASALEKAVPQAEALAEPLAKLYALARYTPADEPLPPAAIAEARGYLCELAGVSAG
jgi:hypothetical protein